MLKWGHKGWVVFSGIVWFSVGFSLLYKGIQLLVSGAYQNNAFFIDKLSNLAGGREQAAMLLVFFALGVGFIKGRFILIRTIRRVVKRIVSLPTPIKISQVYSLSYVFLIIFMIGLGMSMRFLGLSDDVRGTIDLAIGSALMNGALLYFRFGLVLKKEAMLR